MYKVSIDLYLNHRQREVYQIDSVITSAEGNSYEIQERIDSGGNAVVHRCLDAGTGDEYAVKFNLTFSARRIRRFLQEIELLKAIDHDQIIKYIDHGTTQGRYDRRGARQREIHYFIMPIAETNLLEYRKTHQITYADYIGQFKGICSALTTLHEKAIHRDLKPENILIIGETWYLSDLGLCKYNVCDVEISLEDEIIGPRFWMSPESINRVVGNSDEISVRSDVYQLASIFWFVVTGRNPQGVITEGDCTGPEALFAPLFKSLHHDPRVRYNDASELNEAIDETTAG